MKPTTTSAILAALVLSTAAAADDRDIQIRSIDFDAGTLELHNFGVADADLTGWRFCSHDFDQLRQYSGSTGFDAVTIEAGTSIFVHYNNDAPATPDAINRSTLGGNFALPLAPLAYGIQIFHPNASGFVSFGDSTLISDALMWAEDSGNVGSAGFRADQTVSVGIWTGENDFIDTEPASSLILLKDHTGAFLHGPSDYAVDPCPADLNFDGFANLTDVTTFIDAFIASSPLADLNGDGFVNLTDVTDFIAAFQAGC